MDVIVPAGSLRGASGLDSSMVIDVTGEHHYTAVIHQVFPKGSSIPPLRP